MYTLKDYVEKDLIVKCNYLQACKLAEKLKNEGIDTTVITDMVTVLDSEYYLGVENNKLLILCDEYIYDMKDQYHIIVFQDLNISQCNCKCHHAKEFQLHEVVHVMIHGLLGSVQHITAYISAIDRENEMCEINYLHEKNEVVWVCFSDVFHIEHIYDQQGDAYD